MKFWLYCENLKRTFKTSNYINMLKDSLILALFLLSACGKGPNTIDPAFQTIYDQFIADSNTNGVNLDPNQGITIQFATLEQQNSVGEVVGQCDQVGWGRSNIQIDTKFWNSSGIADQTVLLYHELGHCVLDEIHTSNRMAIMNPAIPFPAEFYPGDMAGMVNQLFIDRGDGSTE